MEILFSFNFKIMETNDFYCFEFEMRTIGNKLHILPIAAVLKNENYENNEFIIKCKYFSEIASLMAALHFGFCATGFETLWI